MKLKLSVVAISSIFASTFASAATVYQNEDTTLNFGGRVEVRGNFSDANKTESNNNIYSDASRVRISVDGTQKLSDQVNFFGKYEFELTEKEDGSKDDVSVNTRFLYAGVETHVGNFYYGHQNNAVTYLTDWTDAAETYSGYINEYTVTTADRAKNVLRYEWTANSGLSLQVSGNFNSDSESAKSNGYGAVVAYALPFGLDLGVGYAASDETYGNGEETDTTDAYMAAAKYTHETGIYVSALYQGGNISAEGIQGSNYNATDAYLGYNFGQNNINLTYSYFYADEIRDLDINFIGVEYARYMGNMTFFGSYKINLLDEGRGGIGDNDQDEVMLGMRYSF